MSALFEELANAETAMGTVSLRRRREPSRKIDVYEVKLGDDFLMSSLFTVAEVELARLALDALPHGELDVVVGGLGLGYTAQAVLQDERVSSLVVIEALADVIDWHDRRLLPDVAELTADARSRIVHGDFFAMCASDGGFDPGEPGRLFDAVLVDIDHSPRHVLQPQHAEFYTARGVGDVAHRLIDDGVFALWSNDPPDPEFLDLLTRTFQTARAQVVTFPNFLTGGESSNTIYVATKSAPTGDHRRATEEEEVVDERVGERRGTGA